MKETVRQRRSEAAAPAARRVFGNKALSRTRPGSVFRSEPAARGMFCQFIGLRDDSVSNQMRRCGEPSRASVCTRATAKTVERSASAFDLPLAVALAGVSFEAYLEPRGAEGYADVSKNDTRTTYTDGDFLCKAFDGLLEVKPVSASGLRPADPNGKSDPYVTFSVRDSYGRSSVLLATLDPVWPEGEAGCHLYVSNIENDLLRVRVLDEDLFKSDDDLGNALLPLAALADGEARTVTLPLRGPNAQGTVTLRLSFSSFSGGESSAGAALVDAATTGDATLPSSAPPGVASALSAGSTGQGNSWLSASGLDLTQPEQLIGRSAAAAAAAVSQLESVFGASTVPWRSIQKMLETIRTMKTDETVAALAHDEPLTDNERADLVRAATEKLVATAGEEEAERLAVKLVEVSEDIKEAAADPTAISALWKALAAAAGKRIEDIFQPVAYVENDDTDTQVWLYRNPSEAEVVVAFRGTEMVKWRDFLTDVNLVPSTLNPERVDEDRGMPVTLRIVKSLLQRNAKDTVMVHQGFLQAYDSVKPRVFSLVDALAPRDGSPLRIYVTGHSLGGALAALAAFELATIAKRNGLNRSVTVYTYGAPRVGNRAFAEQYNTAVPDSWRLANVMDIVPSVPRLAGYCHTRHGVQLQPSGTLKFMDSGDIFGEGKSQMEVLGDLYERSLTEQQASASEAAVAAERSSLDAVKERELELLQTLVNGSALSQHMETNYLFSLRECVMAALGTSKL